MNGTEINGSTKLAVGPQLDGITPCGPRKTVFCTSNLTIQIIAIVTESRVVERNGAGIIAQDQRVVDQAGGVGIFPRGEDDFAIRPNTPDTGEHETSDLFFGIIIGQTVDRALYHDANVAPGGFD